MLVRHAMMALLYDGGEAHGYELGKQLGDVFLRTTNYGQIYQGLKQLEEEGCVTKRLHPGGSADRGGPPRWMYQLTAKGERALRTWAERPPADDVKDRCIEILVRLLALDGDAAAVTTLLERERATTQAAYGVLVAVDVKPGTPIASLARLAIAARERSHLEWIDQVVVAYGNR